MAEEDEGTGPGDGPGEWLGIAEAARRLGVVPKAVRNRVARGTLRWRPAGNRGREVFIPDAMEPAEDPGDGPPSDPGTDPGTVGLRVLVARLEERLAAAEDGARLEAEILRGQVETEVAARNAVIEEMRAALARERDRADRLAAELAEARKPWAVRLVEAFRRR